MTQDDDDELLDERAAAEILDLKPGTLSIWRSTGRYPLPYVKIGHGWPLAACGGRVSKPLFALSNKAVSACQAPHVRPRAVSVARRYGGSSRRVVSGCRCRPTAIAISQGVDHERGCATPDVQFIRTRA